MLYFSHSKGKTPHKTKAKAERSIIMKRAKIAVIICAFTVAAVFTGMVVNTIQTGAFDGQGLTTLAVCTVMLSSASVKYNRLKADK
jgi:phosphate/sulfate permease